MQPIRNNAYRGNTKIKPKGQEIEWTPELLEEYMKCRDDAVYFCTNYIKIVHVDHGLINFEPYDYQLDIIKAITGNRDVIVNTSRQAGKTTTAVAVILHFALFNPHKAVALLANKGDAALEIMSRIRLAYEELPLWLQQGVIEWNKGNAEFENGSKIYAAATSSSSIRGKTVAFLYIDEAAHVENWDEFYQSVLPTISSGKETKLLMTSTPNGLNHFYVTFDGAVKKKNTFVHIEVPWNMVPGRDEAWKEDQMLKLNGDIEKFNQEYNCQFLGSSGTLISGSVLKSLVVQTPIQITDYGLSIYFKPEEDRAYTCIVDVGRGKGLDYSAFSIIDITEMPYQQVCTFKNNLITPIEYAETIHRLATYYNVASIMIEINDIGGQVADILNFDLEYDNMIFTEGAGRNGKKISGGFGGKNVDKGIRTTVSVKAIGCNTLKMLIEQTQLVLNDHATIEELKRFSRKGKSYEAEVGAHDDLVMTLVLFAWLSAQSYFRELTDINTLAELRQKTEEQLIAELLPFGLSNNPAEELEEEQFVPSIDQWMREELDDDVMIASNW